MRVGIDASNLRAGGTVTHLIELLRVAEPIKHGFEEVTIWAGHGVLNKIEERPWLRKVSDPLLEQAENPFLDRRHIYRAFWQRFRLRRLAQESRCDLLFVPGGVDTSGFRPMVTMSRNMLPFNLGEASRYGFSLALLRLLLLRWLQVRTFRRADGVIFMTEYARDRVSRIVNGVRTAIIPHGVSNNFSYAPRRQRDIQEYSSNEPFKLLYVSTVDMYKHQWHVVNAVAQLRSSGIPVTLDLIGPANGRALNRLLRTLNRVDASSKVVRYRGPVPYDELHKFYRQADLKIFASSCENMPNILIEAMAAGLPIACSNRAPMPEFLGNAGVYFDPEEPTEIVKAISLLVGSPELRARNAAIGFERAQQYSWTRCANQTLSFLAECTTR